jgi:hypothetical protein
MDLLAAETYWMNTLMFTLTKGGIAPFVGDTLGSKAISPQTFIYCHEIIDQALRFSSGFQLDDSHVGLDEIHKVGAGKSYVSAPTTLKKYKTGPAPEDHEELMRKGEEFIGKVGSKK